MSARPNLRLVDPQGELQGEVDPAVIELSKKIAVLARENTRLKNEAVEREGKGPDAKAILDILQFHKRLVSPRARIVRNGAAWKNVKARLADVDAETDKPAFTVLHLKAAVVGLSMDTWARDNKLLGAAWLFANEGRVQRYVDAASQFKRETGTSALAIIDELGRGGYERLAEVCDCGHIRLEHEKERPELSLLHPPCAVHGCACPGWSTDVVWERLRDTAERERMAS